jgi:hypothetical protein
MRKLDEIIESIRLRIGDNYCEEMEEAIVGIYKTSQNDSIDGLIEILTISRVQSFSLKNKISKLKRLSDGLVISLFVLTLHFLTGTVLGLISYQLALITFLFLFLIMISFVVFDKIVKKMDSNMRSFEIINLVLLEMISGEH